MEFTYKLQTMGQSVKRSDGVFIPFSPDNTDYQQYLEWLAEGNVPTPADEVTQ